MNTLRVLMLFRLGSDKERDDAVYLILWLIVGLSLTFGTLHWRLGAPYAAASNGCIATLFTLLAILFRSHLFSRRWTVAVALGGAWLHIVTTILLTGGDQSNSLVWLVTLPLGAALFAETWILGAMLILVFSAFPLIHYLGTLNWIVAMNASPAATGGYAFRTCSYVAVILILTISVYFLGRAVSKRFETEVLHGENMTELLRFLTHDIATPTTVICTWADALKAGSLSPERENHAVLAIHRNATALRSLIQKVRELRALESGKTNLRLIPSDVRTCVDRAIQMVQDGYDRKGVKLAFIRTEDSVHAHVEPDILGLQIIPNLLTNALKFSHPGQEVAVKVESERDAVTVLVADQGIGIPPDTMRDIFSHHHATTRLGTQGEKGTGFGMPLVKSFVEKMNGTIAIESDHGTTVRIRFRRG